jgi:hypothetical protein
VLLVDEILAEGDAMRAQPGRHVAPEQLLVHVAAEQLRLNF